VVAGNAADVTAGVMQAAASGVTAAVAINADLTAEDTAAAVAAWRAARSDRRLSPRSKARCVGWAPGQANNEAAAQIAR
jgi:hypothetical protein